MRRPEQAHCEYRIAGRNGLCTTALNSPSFVQLRGFDSAISMASATFSVRLMRDWAAPAPAGSMPTRSPCGEIMSNYQESGYKRLNLWTSGTAVYVPKRRLRSGICHLMASHLFGDGPLAVFC